MTNNKIVEWILRIAVAGEFIGHGIFALQVKAGWFKYFEAVGISQAQAEIILPIIGVMDILVAIIILIRPVPIVLLWMASWGLLTAMIRWPIGPDPIGDFIERWANWGAPLALLFLKGWPSGLKKWFW